MKIDNKVFCALPFKYVYIDSVNEYKLCSDARLSSKISTNDMSILEYFNSNYLNEIRDDMINGVLSDKIKGTCIRCLEREELNSWSRRETEIDDVVLLNYKSDFYNIPTSKVFKLKFGNLCNLKCLTCGPYSSSRWAKERNDIKEKNLFKNLKDEISVLTKKKYGNLYDNSHDVVGEHEWPIFNYNFNKNFYNELEILLKNIEFIIVSGGEPFINDNFYEFLQWLITNKFSKKLNLVVFSNMTKLPKNYKYFYDKFKTFKINISIDGVGKKDEYIRRGTNFEVKDKNIKQVSKYFNIDFCVTLSMLNVGYQKELHSYTNKYQKIPNFFNVLVEPFYFQINNLPTDVVNLYESKGEKHRLLRSEMKNIDYFMLGISFLKKYDEIHNTCLINEWPEFYEYYYKT